MTFASPGSRDLLLFRAHSVLALLVLVHADAVMPQMTLTRSNYVRKLPVLFLSSPLSSLNPRLAPVIPVPQYSYIFSLTPLTP
jgi:hypothetical protein